MVDILHRPMVAIVGCRHRFDVVPINYDLLGTCNFIIQLKCPQELLKSVRYINKEFVMYILKYVVYLLCNV